MIGEIGMMYAKTISIGELYINSDEGWHGACTMIQHVIAITISLFLACLPLARLGIAGEIQSNDSGTIWQAGIDGVEIEWGPDGSFSRIYSRFSQPVEVGDRRGILKASTIAEEKAKAAIIRFLDQNVASARLVAEVENDMSTTTQSGAKPKAVHTDSERRMIESLTEVTSSVAAGRLRGVMVLDRGYNEKEGVVFVKVGDQQSEQRSC